MASLLTAGEHADAVPYPALTRTPLAGLKARNPRDYLNAWALLGTWTCTRVWPTPMSRKWPKACLAATDQLKERHSYLGAWARSSFEQGALCALAAISSEKDSFFALPGDAVFQCHGVSPCVSAPPRAVLPLVVHYYECKDNIPELHCISALPTLPQALFGHQGTPAYWTTGDWQPAAGITLPRFLLTWGVPCWVSWTYDSEQCHSDHLVTPLQGNLADGLPTQTSDLEMEPGGPCNETPPQSSAQELLVEEDSKINSQDTDDDPMEIDPDVDTIEQSNEHLKDCSAPVYYYGTGLFGGLPVDLPTDRMDVIVRLSGAYGPSLSQMFCSATKNGTNTACHS